jgi:DNA-binding XRE family transcriptional regulator
MINAAQCRMARVALKWNLDDLSERANVSRATIHKLEVGVPTITPLVKCALQRAFEAQGIEFIDNGLRLPESEKE